MIFQTDYHDTVSILAEVRRRSRLIEPVIRHDLTVLLERRTPSGLPRLADAARDGCLCQEYGREMLPILIEACDRAIEDGTGTTIDWYEAGYADGAAEWACREIEVMTSVALSLLPIRRDLGIIVELLERVGDLISAQHDIGAIRSVQMPSLSAAEVSTDLRVTIERLERINDLRAARGRVSDGEDPA